MTGFSVSTTETNLSLFALAIQQLYAGRSNAAGSVTLAAGATSTIVSAPNCASQCAVFLFQQTANGAAALGTTYISAVGMGSFTISHANNAQVDRTFFYLCIG